MGGPSGVGPPRRVGNHKLDSCSGSPHERDVACGRPRGRRGARRHDRDARLSRGSSSDGPPERARTAPHGRRLGPVRHRLRQRRLVDLLRARARRRARARADAARLPVRRRPVRADGEDLRRGRLDVPRGRRLVLLRPPRVQRGRLLLRRLGAVAGLHPHDRHLGVLRAVLPERVPGPRGAQPQPGRHHRRPDRDRRCSSLLNIRGLGESAKLNFILAIVDLATQVLLVAPRARSSC